MRAMPGLHAAVSNLLLVMAAIGKSANAALILRVMVAAVLWSAAPGRSADPPDGRALFAKHCASCHGPKGQPNEKVAKLLGVKDLTQSKTTAAEIERQILEGRRQGERQLMPPFKEALKPEEVKALVPAVIGLRPAK
jgi:mono/diheme cytochrome c family protein